MERTSHTRFASMDDLFIKIISGEIPSAKIYEDEFTFAFLDINPNTKGHTLVIPKKRFRNIFDIDEETFLRTMKTVRTLAPIIRRSLNADGMNIQINNEPSSGQEVFHFHVHLIPRHQDDATYQKAKHVHYSEGEMEQIAARIRSNL